jgi:hypothetical protein
MAKSPAYPKLRGLLATSVTMTTIIKITDLEIRTPSINIQFTSEKSNVHIFLKSNAGRQNFDTKAPIPFPWDDEMRFIRPAM